MCPRQRCVSQLIFLESVVQESVFASQCLGNRHVTNVNTRIRHFTNVTTVIHILI